MKITDLKDKTLIVAKHQSGYEVLMKCNWWELMDKWLLTYEGVFDKLKESQVSITR